MIPTADEQPRRSSITPDPNFPASNLSNPPPPSDILHNRYPYTYSVSEPLNREPPLSLLLSTPLTPSHLAYDRNHSPFPHIPPLDHTISLIGLLSHPLTLSLPTLSSYPQTTVLAALQCAGNRRHEMRTKVREVSGIDWNSGAVFNATWSGVLLSSILSDAGVMIKEGHVWFDSAISKTQDDDWYGVSIPLSRCLDPEWKVLVATHMNGEPLSVEHGAPVRIVAPGVAGARWTKWVTRIVVSDRESPNFYQQKDYKILPDWVRTKEAAAKEWGKHPAMIGLPVNSVVGIPETGAVMPMGGFEVKGYALPMGDEGPVEGVEVSLDGGETWGGAEIVWPTKEEMEKDGGAKVRWAWAIWRFEVGEEVCKRLGEREEWREGRGRVLSRAWDRGGNKQDEKVPWNWRGVGFNAYGEAEGLGLEVEEKRKGTRESVAVSGKL